MRLKMQIDIWQWVKASVSYQKAKVGTNTCLLPGSFPLPDELFVHVHVDITGPLPVCEGQSYLLSCLDCFSHWCEALPIKDITVYNTAKTFVAGWVSRFGIPAVITRDGGKQFKLDLFNQLMTLLGSRRIKTTAYHPEANGLVEQFHSSLKSVLKARVNQSSCQEHLLLVLLELQTVVKENIKCSFVETTPWRVVSSTPQKHLNMTLFVDQLTARQIWHIIYLRRAKGSHMCLNFCRHAYTFLCVM